MKGQHVSMVLPFASKRQCLAKQAMVNCIAHIAATLLNLSDTSGQGKIHDTVYIQSKREQWASLGRFTQVIVPKETQTKNELLFNSGSYIRQYGAGSLATIGRRGADPVQTQVLWNGIPTANSALGMTDLNLLMNNLNNKIIITDGPGSSFNGSGAIGGSINLSNSGAGSSPMLSNTFTAGSYNSWYNNLFGSLNIKKTGIQFSHFYNEAKNNFPYTESTPAGKTAQITQNANTSANGVSLGINTEIKGLKLFTLFESGNYFQRIPKTLSSSDPNASQVDKYNRFLLTGGKAWQKHTLQVKLSSINNFLWYRNQVLQTSDTTLSRGSYALIDYLYTLNRYFKILVQFDAMHTTATVRQYGRKGIIDAPAGTTSLRFQQNKITAQTTTRYEMRENLFVYSGAAEYNAFCFLRVFANLGTTFRRATLNDIYWGNSARDSLKPESGKYAEIGYQLFSDSKKLFAISLTQSLYTRQINNNIRWIPVGTEWLPVNFNKFSALGLQSSLKLQHAPSASFSWGCNAQADLGQYYTWQKASAKQHPLLVPAINTSTSLFATFKPIRLELVHTYTGKRAADLNNTAFLEPVSLIHGAVYYKINMSKKTLLSLRLLVQNLCNTSYVILPDRPMPGRNYQLSLNLQIQ